MIYIVFSSSSSLDKREGLFCDAIRLELEKQIIIVISVRVFRDIYRLGRRSSSEDDMSSWTTTNVTALSFSTEERLLRLLPNKLCRRVQQHSRTVGLVNVKRLRRRLRAARNDDFEQQNDDPKDDFETEKMVVPKLVAASLGAAVVATLVVASSEGGGGSRDMMSSMTSRAFSSDVERDPVRAFSVYGDVSKEYKVNKYDDAGRIVGRTRGVSVTACTQLVPREEDTTSSGSLRGRPTKTDDDDDDDFRACDVTAQPLEKVETAADIAPSCDAACRRSCREATKKYDRDQKKRFGFGFDAEEEGKVVRACGKQCAANCMKGGTGRYDFLIPFRF